MFTDVPLIVNPFPKVFTFVYVALIVGLIIYYLYNKFKKDLSCFDDKNLLYLNRNKINN